MSCYHESESYAAPNVFNASLNSLIAVLVSSKFSAEIAHLACFCAWAIASSSTSTKLGLAELDGKGAG
jgi:hypothetical protein